MKGATAGEEHDQHAEPDQRRRHPRQYLEAVPSDVGGALILLGFWVHCMRPNS
jgi:hypothetical protein